MKKNYIAPEAKLLGFAPVENLASQLDDLLGTDVLNENQVSGVTVNPDFDIDLDL